MSTDLELHQQSQFTVSKIKLPPIEVRSSKLIEEEEEVVVNVEECRTPTSEEHRIPVLKSPPMAPRKKRCAASCKGRRLESEFCEVVYQSEIDEFFRSCHDHAVNLKRKRLCMGELLERREKDEVWLVA